MLLKSLQDAHLFKMVPKDVRAKPIEKGSKINEMPQPAKDEDDEIVVVVRDEVSRGETHSENQVHESEREQSDRQLHTNLNRGKPSVRFQGASIEEHDSIISFHQHADPVQTPPNESSPQPPVYIVPTTR